MTDRRYPTDPESAGAAVDRFVAERRRAIRSYVPLLGVMAAAGWVAVINGQLAGSVMMVGAVAGFAGELWRLQRTLPELVAAARRSSPIDQGSPRDTA